MVKTTASLARTATQQSGDSGGVSGLPDAMFLSPATALGSFPGAGLLLDSQGHVVAANGSGRPLVPAFDRGGDSALRGMVADAAREGRVVADKVEIEVDDGALMLDIVCLPLDVADGDRFVLALSRDATSERKLVDALVASRQMFKDLVACSTDFAWETHANGTFAFVSARGALGYTAHELNRRQARQLLLKPAADDQSFPFESTIPHEDAEVWMRRADGGTACLLVSSLPIFSRDGEWQGARGVARDVTEMRERDIALERARHRERLLGVIVDSIRNEIEPAAMLETAAETTAETVVADHCWILRRDAEGRFRRAAVSARVDSVLPETADFVAMDTASSDSARGVTERSIDGVSVLTAVSRYHGEANGAVCICRPQGGEAWTDVERGLLVGVADCLGIAIEQIANHEQLERVSRTDELTGLFNRRAFFEEVGRRLVHHRRTRRSGTLVYVDLDNFKPVNDVHGHHQGDAVLRELAAMLADGTRIADIVARLGGDEFALWLEETDETAAIAKAKSLLADSHRLRPLSADDARPLGISIGMAVSDPAADESLDDLVARADKAMYQVKHGGKSGIAVARNRRRSTNNSGGA
jgi:diguanylate cyclase (GGDEF)-like protein/PAS domain S-box-containing protein